MTTHDDYVKAAPLEAVPPGKMTCVSLQGKRILLANENGTIFAADEMCTHEDASLCLGSLRGHLLKCPLHGSRFDLTTGKPLDEPADTPLKVYPVKIIANDIFVKIQ